VRPICPTCGQRLLPEDYDDDTETYECNFCGTECPVPART
jgi:hypothetical protein